MASPTQFKVCYRNNLGTPTFRLIAQFMHRDDAIEWAEARARRMARNDHRPNAKHFIKVTYGGVSGKAVVSWRQDNADGKGLVMTAPSRRAETA